MKTDFVILWVDNNKDFVESLRPQLERWMDNHGFGLTISWYKGESGIYDDLANKEIELIVLDYKLSGAKNGDKIITEIRVKNFFQDIIFYTTGSTPDDVFEKPPDGVFFVPRGDVKDRIKDLIGLRIKRASDLATLRGWIVADSIEMETALGNVLAKCFKETEVLFRQRVLSDDAILNFGQKHTVLNGILKDNISEINKSGRADSDSDTKLKACKKILDSFPKEIIEVRNALAHQMAEMDETGHKKIKTKTKEAKDIVITLEECVEIRKNVRKHMANLIELESLV